MREKARESQRDTDSQRMKQSHTERDRREYSNIKMNSTKKRRRTRRGEREWPEGPFERMRATTIHECYNNS